MANIALSGITKSFGFVKVIDDISLDISDGEFVVFVGPSGCGKSTTLRMLAGLEIPTAGRILIDGRDVTSLPPGRRNIAMVFQNYALYPHMTVAENMSFSLRLQNAPKEEINTRVRDAARVLHIEQLLDRKPKALSGGQRQRVALGRAIVRAPSAFLFDEPLSNLDAQLRNHMRVEIALLQKKLKGTMVYVTHDQVEAMTLADRIVVFNKGQVQQLGTPEHIFEHPANLFVAKFIGNPMMNVFPCSYDGRLRLAGQAATLPVPDRLRPALEAARGRELLLGIRPQALQLAGEGASGEEPSIEATIEISEYLGAETVANARLKGAPNVQITAVLPGRFLGAGEVRFQVDLAGLHVFDAETELVLAADL